MSLKNETCKGIFWFRNDLRIQNNPGLYNACKENQFLICVYIFNDDVYEAQKWWLHHSLKSLDESLKKLGLKLVLKKGNPKGILNELIDKHSIKNVYWNRRYDPDSIEIDTHIKTFLSDKNIKVSSFNSTLLIEPWNFKNIKGEPYKVFTPFLRAIQKTDLEFDDFSIKDYPKAISETSENVDSFNFVKKWSSNFLGSPGEPSALKSLNDFISNSVNGYKESRDFFDLKCNSYLSAHLHFGEISLPFVYKTIENLKNYNEVSTDSINCFLSQLIWREFSYHILYHYPDFSNKNFKKEFDNFPWKKDLNLLKAWQYGNTGYKIVDAAMNELWTTGFMHNRARMITANFLTKILLIDWRLGAKWFMDTLLDADIANNSMGWQWCASTGVDSAPYFRIFNPTLQSEKFDANNDYVNKWCKEINTPKIVDYEQRRIASLQAYENMKKGFDNPI